MTENSQPPPENPNNTETTQPNTTESIENYEIPIGEDPQLNRTIQLLIETSGFELHDQTMIPFIEKALTQKLDSILANCRLRTSGQDSSDATKLSLSEVKQALNESGRISIDRPEFILEQPNSKMTTRRTKVGK